MHFLFLLTPVWFWPQSAEGTTGVAIWTPGRAVLAMDSRITLTAGDYVARGGDTCKIRAAGRFYLAIAGLHDHPATKFDAWQLAAEAVAGAHSVEEAAMLVEKRLGPELQTALFNIQASDVAGFRRHFAQAHLAIAIAGMDAGAPAMAARAFLPDANAALHVVRWSKPASAFVFGETKAISAVYTKPAALVDAVGAIEAARRLVQLEIDRAPERVGPPIAILQLTNDGANWVQGGLCAGTRENR